MLDFLFLTLSKGLQSNFSLYFLCVSVTYVCLLFVFAGLVPEQTNEMAQATRGRDGDRQEETGRASGTDGR